MTLADFSIRRPVFAWMLMFGLLVFGAISFGRLGVSLMPDVDFPVLSIRITWEGAAPEFIEAELVDPIEQAVMAVEGLTEIRSTVRLGTGDVELLFSLDRDVDAALQEVQSALSRIRLPLNVQPPVIRKSSPEADPIMWIGVAGSQSLLELIEYVDTYLIDEFQVLPGVGEVSLGGYSEPNLRIWVDQGKLRERELTILDVQQAIQNEHAELAGGYLEDARRETNVRTLGEGLTPEEVAEIFITRRGGQPVFGSVIRIGDVARVEDGLSDIRRIARFSGTEGVSIGIRKQRGSNEVDVGRRVKQKVDELNGTLPEGMRLQINVDFTRFVEQAVKHTEHELILSGILTALICYLFLGSWRLALNVILAIPTSIVGTFIVLYFLNFTLNTFTLLALALAIGIVVDDAIMVLENIVRHFGMGKNRVVASGDGAREITFAALAATVAVIAIFLPVAFMEGVIGQFFFQFGVTITAAVAFSLLEALTLTPMRCSIFMVRQEPTWIARGVDRGFLRLRTGYSRLLGLALRARWVVVVGAFALFAASLWWARDLRREFVPPQDQNYVRIGIRMPTDASLAYSDNRTREVETYLQTRPEVARYMASVGGFTGNPNQSGVLVTLVEKKDRALSQAELMDEFRRDLAGVQGVRLSYQDISTRGLTARRSQPVEFNLRGPDLDRLDEVSQRIIEAMDASGLVVDTDSTYRTGKPELQILPDRAAAAARGVSMAAIAGTINAAIGGLREGKFSRGGRRYDVRIKLDPGEDGITAEDIQGLLVRTQFGELIPLSDVVKMETKQTLQSITRINRQRAISISASLAAGASQAAALASAERIAREQLPPGYSFSFEGGASTFQEAASSLQLAFVLGILVAYMVLASQFNSFLHPLTVLLALPFSISGALGTLWLTGQSLNLYSAIGVILLMGIAKKNSILLVEFANQLRHEKGMGVQEAVLSASPIRLRPIIMTSISTIAAATPLAMGLGAGAEARQPMALAVIGGMGVSTLFTLFVVPCAYLLLSRLERRQPGAGPGDGNGNGEAESRT